MRFTGPSVSLRLILAYNARKMLAPVVAFLVGIIVLVIFASKSLVKVPRDFEYVIRTMGKFDRVLEPGVHVILPFVSRIGARISTLDQLLDVPACECVMRDGARATIEGTVRYRVADSTRAASEVADYRTATASLAAGAWQRGLAAADPARALEALYATEAEIRTAAAAWGIEVLNAVPLLHLDDAVMPGAKATAPTSDVPP